MADVSYRALPGLSQQAGVAVDDDAGVAERHGAGLWLQQRHQQVLVAGLTRPRVEARQQHVCGVTRLKSPAHSGYQPTHGQRRPRRETEDGALRRVKQHGYDDNTYTY